MRHERRGRQGADLQSESRRISAREPRLQHTGSRSRSTVLLAPVVLIAALAGSGCSEAAPDDDWVARVGDQHIASAAFEAEMARVLARYERNGTPVPPAVARSLRGHVRERMIADEILYQQAMALELRVADDALDAAVAADRARFRTEAAYTAHIRDAFGDATRARAALRRRLRIEQAVDVLGEDLALGTDAPACADAAGMPAAAELGRAACLRRAVLAAVAPGVDIERRDLGAAHSHAAEAAR